MTYTEQAAYETVERIVQAGWKFEVYTYVPEMRGWWTKADGDTTHEMRRGDPRPFYEGAAAVEELYLSAA